MARSRFLPDSFTLALLGTVTLASVLPASGVAAQALEGITVAAVALLFFLHGAKLSRDAIVAGLSHWRLHLVVVGTTFVLFPLLGWVLRPVLLPLVTPEAHRHPVPVRAARHGAVGHRVHGHGAWQHASGHLQCVGIDPAGHCDHAAAGGAAAARGAAAGERCAA